MQAFFHLCASEKKKIHKNYLLNALLLNKLQEYSFLDIEYTRKACVNKVRGEGLKKII